MGSKKKKTGVKAYQMGHKVCKIVRRDIITVNPNLVNIKTIDTHNPIFCLVFTNKTFLTL